MTYLCLLDESGREVRPDRWFIYGGLIIPWDQVDRLHRDVWRIRRELGLDREVPLKWQRPTGRGTRTISTEQHDRSIIKTLGACRRRGAKFLAVLTPAGITVSTQAQNRSIQIGASYVFGVLQRIFMEENEHGVVLVDSPHGSARLDPIEAALLGGVPAGIAGYSRRRYFDRIVCTAVTSIRSSRLVTTIDIALGALNFCLSCHRANLTRAKTLYSNLKPLILRRPAGEGGSPWGLGLKIRPISFTEPEYLEFANRGWTRLVRLGEVRPPPWHRPELRVE